MKLERIKAERFQTLADFLCRNFLTLFLAVFHSTLLKKVSESIPLAGAIEGLLIPRARCERSEGVQLPYSPYLGLKRYAGVVKRQHCGL